MRGICLIVVITVVASSASAQPMINQSVPLQNLGSSFYENNGVSWNFSGPNFFANSGGNNVVPPFGNFDPNAGLRTGAGFSAGRVSGSIGLNLAQGSSRSNVTTVPSITTMNGYPGSISDQTMRPFVTSITPVVGGGVLIPTPVPSPSPVLQAYYASQQSDLQHRRQANYDRTQKKAFEYFNRGLKAEEEDDLKKARANYRRALGTAQGELRLAIQRRIQSRGW